MLFGSGLALLLLEHSAQAAPATLTATLGKLAVSGIGATTAVTGGAPAKNFLVAWLLNPVRVAVMLLLGVVSLVWVRSMETNSPTAEGTPLVEGIETPVDPAPTWRGRAFCPMCALPFTNNRRTSEGIFIHTENGEEIIYDLQLPQPVPDFHQRFCGPSMRNREATSVNGKSEQRDGRRWLLPEKLEVAPK